jgi:hypothetical protein
MTPLDAMLKWWETLDESVYEIFSSMVCFRLTGNGEPMEHAKLFRELLSETLPANQHIGRALAIRAIVDYEFATERDSTPAHLENVEGADIRLKSLSNAALGRMQQRRIAMDEARRSWILIRANEISDNALESAERNAMVRPWLDS